MMGDERDNTEQLTVLLDGLKIDASIYFDKAKEALPDTESTAWLVREHRVRGRDEFWAELPEDLHNEAKRLDHRLVSLMGQIARAVRSAPLVSEADQRDVMIGTKAMRASLMLRRFDSW